MGNGGGKNLYAFVGNSPQSDVDIMGLFSGINKPSRECQVMFYFGHGAKGYRDAESTKPEYYSSQPKVPSSWKDWSYWGYFSCYADKYNDLVPAGHRIGGMPGVAADKRWVWQTITDSDDSDYTNDIVRDDAGAISDISKAWCHVLKKIQYICEEPTSCCKTVRTEFVLKAPYDDISDAYEDKLDDNSSSVYSCDGLDAWLETNLWNDGLPKRHTGNVVCRNIGGDE